MLWLPACLSKSENNIVVEISTLTCCAVGRACVCLRLSRPCSCSWARERKGFDCPSPDARSQRHPHPHPHGAHTHIHVHVLVRLFGYRACLALFWLPDSWPGIQHKHIRRRHSTAGWDWSRSWQEGDWELGRH